MNILSSQFCGVSFENPFVLASGYLGVTGAGMADVVFRGAGGVTTKSWWEKAHKGHANPVIIANEHAILNAVGLPDAGIEKSREEIAEYRKRTKAPIIVSIVAPSPEEYGEITKLAAELSPDILEVNISCPNVKEEFCDLFSGNTRLAEVITKSVKKESKNIPVSIKLSPNVPNIAEVARACEANGADAITAINTVGPGMRIDPELRTPILKNKTGGVSGPAIFPIALRCVWDIFQAVDIPIVGTGGICSGRDVAEMMLAGATLCGIGSALHYRGTDAFRLLSEELEEFCQKEGVKNVSELIGGAHRL
ncbi:dihydroorotate dehydrogenase [Candidatus Peregrinibacteria bacterium]|nr:MAG: dihydroorotate dehydrogenase [Candidatus Peregrinibacteria bacterium]